MSSNDKIQSQKLTILAAAENVYSLNVSSFFISGQCTGDESLQLKTPIVKTIKCQSGAYSDSVDLTAIADGTLTLTIENEAQNDSASITKVKDATPPTIPSPIDDGVAWTDLTSTPLMTWTASTDAGSGFKKYRYSIGTAPGLSDTIPWTDTNALSLQISSGLSLVLNSFYYLNIQAIDNFGNAISMSSDGWRVVTSITVAPKSSTAVNWNDYYKTATPTTFCDGSETRRNCSHGGEKKKINLADIPTCANLTMKDSLDLFYWRCDATTGNAVFESVMVKEGKGLKTLISTNGQWKKLQAYLFQSNIPIRATTEATWWTNTLTPLPDNSATTSMNLSASGTIYYINSDQLTSGYYITADKISFVSLNNSKLNFNSASPANCDWNGVAGSNFKALFCSNNRKFTWLEIDSTSGGNCYMTGSDLFSTISNSTSTCSLNLSGNKFLVKNSTVKNTYGSTASASIFENLIDTNGFTANSSTSNNTFNRIKSSGSLQLGDNSGSTFPSRAIAIESNTITWGFSQRATINNAKSSTLSLQSTTNLTVSQLFSFSAQAISSSVTKMTGLWLQLLGHSCMNIGGDTGFSGTCVMGGLSNATAVPNIGFTATLKNITGDGTTQNEAFVPGSTCPSAAHGNKAVTNQESSAKTYLLNAYEIIGDEVGNDNLLCESNEACVYMPNIGSDQGSGDYYSNGTCNFQNGTVTGVLLYAYPNP